MQVEIVQKSSSNGEDGQKKDEKSSGLIQLRLLFLDPKKRKTQHKENEAIQFDYNMETDNPENVVIEMVRET